MFHRSERLFLRPAWPEDWEELYCGIADEGIVRNLASAPWPYRAQDARDYIARGLDPMFPSFMLTLPQASGGALLIGGAGFGEATGASSDAELGYWIARPYWGRGYATEAARAVLEVGAMMGLQKIEAGHFLDNPASGKVLCKAGFRPTGHVVQRESLARGEAAPCAQYHCDLKGMNPGVKAA